MFETFELSARYLDELLADTTEADIRKREADFNAPAEIDHRHLATTARPMGHLGLWRPAGFRHHISHADNRPADLLTKPFTSDALAKKVRQILDLDSKDPVTRASAVLARIKDKPHN